jgi:type 1 glutamine amidotransferase
MTNIINSTIRRREAIHTLGVLGAAAGLAALPGMAEDSADGVPRRRRAEALALVGDAYHAADYIFNALTKTLVHGAGISVDFRIDPRDLDPAILPEYRLLIIFRDGWLFPDGYWRDQTVDRMGWPNWGGKSPKVVSIPEVPSVAGKETFWMTAEQGKAIRHFVQEGGSALFYHNAHHSAGANEDFRDVVGATALLHPPIRPFKVKVVDSGHPITRGVSDFVVTDEQHFFRYEKDPKFVLARSVNEDGLTFETYGSVSEAVWAYDYGKGRVCFLEPGHNLHSLWNPEYIKLQQNAVRWLLRPI